MITRLKKTLHLYKNPSYKRNKKRLWYSKLLFKGKHKGIKYFILDLGTHPTAYVQIGLEHPLYSINYSDIPSVVNHVHGGLTYSSRGLVYNHRRHFWKYKWVLGWDYAHCDDYYAFDYKVLENEYKPTLNGKKWTTKEIIEECENFCNSLYIYGQTHINNV